LTKASKAKAVFNRFKKSFDIFRGGWKSKALWTSGFWGACRPLKAGIPIVSELLPIIRSERLSSIRPHALSAVPVATAQSRYPVVFLSPGGDGSVFIIKRPPFTTGDRLNIYPRR
jgi:hypothetical protein